MSKHVQLSPKHPSTMAAREAKSHQHSGDSAHAEATFMNNHGKLTDVHRHGGKAYGSNKDKEPTQRGGDQL
jgi:hypothetical protein